MTFANIIDRLLWFWGANDQEHRNAFYKVLSSVAWIVLGGLIDVGLSYLSGQPVVWRAAGVVILTSVLRYLLAAGKEILIKRALPPNEES